MVVVDSAVTPSYSLLEGLTTLASSDRNRKSVRTSTPRPHGWLRMTCTMPSQHSAKVATVVCNWQIGPLAGGSRSCFCVTHLDHQGKLALAVESRAQSTLARRHEAASGSSLVGCMLLSQEQDNHLPAETLSNVQHWMIVLKVEKTTLQRVAAVVFYGEYQRSRPVQSMDWRY